MTFYCLPCQSYLQNTVFVIDRGHFVISVIQKKIDILEIYGENILHKKSCYFFKVWLCKLGRLGVKISVVNNNNCGQNYFLKLKEIKIV